MQMFHLQCTRQYPGGCESKIKMSKSSWVCTCEKVANWNTDLTCGAWLYSCCCVWFGCTVCWNNLRNWALSTKTNDWCIGVRPEALQLQQTKDSVNHRGNPRARTCDSLCTLSRSWSVYSIQKLHAGSECPQVCHSGLPLLTCNCLSVTSLSCLRLQPLCLLSKIIPINITFLCCCVLHF